MNKLLPRVFENFFINKTRDNIFIIQEETPLDVPEVKTTTYGSNSFTLHVIRTWNFFFQNKLGTTTSLPNLLTPNKFLEVIKTCISEKA